MLGITCGVVAIAACSSSSSSSSSTPTSAATVASASASASSTPTGSGSVNVLYAGSLVNLMHEAGRPGLPDRDRLLGHRRWRGSTALATDIKGKVYKGDVFISASPKATATLDGLRQRQLGLLVRQLRLVHVVLGYNPNSKFAAEIKSKPWYKAITTPGSSSASPTRRPTPRASWSRRR